MEIVRPLSLREAFELVQSEGTVILGGGVFLHMGTRRIELGLDLSDLGLRFIEEREEEIELGAMSTLRDIEKSETLKNLFGGVLNTAVSSIMGIQLRNAATLGGSVWGKYGFSDIITVLLSLDAEVVLYNRGRMKLEKFLREDIKKDILTSIIIKKDEGKGAFSSLRMTELDYPILNTAVVKRRNAIKISVGGRPAGSKYAVEAMEFINKSEPNEEAALRAADIAAGELGFGNDLRASEEYRKEICRVLVKDCILEVL